MSMWERTDAQLLASAHVDPEGFGVFYRRHERAIFLFLVTAVGRGDLAVDLAAETFARALESRAGFDEERGTARNWLFGIARHVLAASLQRGRVDDDARVRMGMRALTLDERLVASVEELAGADDDAPAEDLLAVLPSDQRDAVRGRVVNERPYGELARELRCSEAVVRQRVSRGLASLRRALEGSP
jgi:RNA polymerase sigma-70 factor (ECF subfamily)